MSDTLDFGGEFKSVSERIKGERTDRLASAKRILSFGVSFLDDCLGGIFPNDLIVLGAKTGVGKTALSTIIAHEAVKQGKRVHYFALEAEDREIERRLKFREISEMVYRAPELAKQRHRMNYMDWYTAKVDGMTGDAIDQAVEDKIAARYKTLFTYYKQGEFDSDQLARQVLAIQDQTDLVVLDHLHYIDVPADNEQRGVKEIVKRIRDISLNLGKPVIVVAHLRKSDRRTATLVPDIDDFHGTSDITKIATKCILLSRASDQESQAPHLWPTYIYAPKCRQEGSRTRYGAVLNFNARGSEYEKEYVLGRFNSMATEFEEVDRAEVPHWAVNAVLPPPSETHWTDR